MSARRLKDPDIQLIRSSAATVRALSQLLGVSHHTVWRARQRYTYKRVPGGTPQEPN